MCEIQDRIQDAISDAFGEANDEYDEQFREEALEEDPNMTEEEIQSFICERYYEMAAHVSYHVQMAFENF